MVKPWADVESAALAVESHEGPHGRRVVCVWSEDPTAPDTGQGVYGGFRVGRGPAAVQLSDGEIVALL